MVSVLLLLKNSFPNSSNNHKYSLASKDNTRVPGCEA